ncbi:orotidine-5'-phosphate decarboxylase [Glomus cerebriforme]|uniref:Orotidine 5'-phosphate decarboxylase n=1 Tax=Glomus cerebriforme TaxID=658196 RepID=A0A397T4T2_9GLOM|nr:orotidine-5'-phosphate decarboxylase [Glomus cerebriforme]
MSSISKKYGERVENFSNKAARELLSLIERKKTNLSLALDVTTKREFLEIADKVGPYICLLKTHIDILVDFDQDLIDQLKELRAKHDFLIFEDRKFADIGNTVKYQYSKGIYKIVEWADITNAHPLPGDGIVSGLKEVGLSLGRGLLLLAEMSSKGSLATGAYTEAAIEMARRHKDFVIGFIAGRKLICNDDEDFIVMSPGVGLDASKDGLGQQYKTPRSVIFENGSDIIIVGRGIYGKDKDVATEAQRYRDAGWNAYLERLTN